MHPAPSPRSVPEKVREGNAQSSLLGYVNLIKVIFRPFKRLKSIESWFPEMSANLYSMFSWCVAIVCIEEVVRGINDVSTNRLKFGNSLGIRLPFKLQPLKTSLSRYFLLLVRKIRKKGTQ